MLYKREHPTVTDVIFLVLWAMFWPFLIATFFWAKGNYGAATVIGFGFTGALTYLGWGLKPVAGLTYQKLFSTNAFGHGWERWFLIAGMVYITWFARSNLSAVVAAASMLAEALLSWILEQRMAAKVGRITGTKPTFSQMAYLFRIIRNELSDERQKMQLSMLVDLVRVVSVPDALELFVQQVQDHETGLSGLLTLTDAEVERLRAVFAHTHSSLLSKMMVDQTIAQLAQSHHHELVALQPASFSQVRDGVIQTGIAMRHAVERLNELSTEN